MAALEVRGREEMRSAFNRNIYGGIYILLVNTLSGRSEHDEKKDER